MIILANCTFSTYWSFAGLGNFWIYASFTSSKITFWICYHKIQYLTFDLLYYYYYLIAFKSVWYVFESCMLDLTNSIYCFCQILKIYLFLILLFVYCIYVCFWFFSLLKFFVAINIIDTSCWVFFHFVILFFFLADFCYYYFKNCLNLPGY